MRVQRWLQLIARRRPLKSLNPLWAAGAASVVAHAAVFASVLYLLPGRQGRHSKSLPILVVQFGDADREWLPVDAVAPDPGTLRQGDAETPGGDNAKKPASDKPDVSRPVVPAPEPTPPKPVVAPKADPPPAVATPPKPPAADNLVKSPPADASTGPNGTVHPGDAALPYAPGGSRLPPGTPSNGGKTVGSATGVRVADGARPPAYPPEAREQGLEGTPVIWLRVSAEGDVLEARVDKSCGYKILDDAALNWARAQKFIPGSRDGVPVEAEVTKPVRFYLY